MLNLLLFGEIGHYIMRSAKCKHLKREGYPEEEDNQQAETEAVHDGYYLRVSIKRDDLLLWVQQFAGVCDVNGSLLFISSQHPDLKASFPQRGDGLRDSILKPVLNTCSSYLHRNKYSYYLDNSLSMLFQFLLLQF